MYKGHVDIDFVSNEMLAKLEFTEHTHVKYAGGFWDELGVPVPDFPYEGPWVYQSFEDNCPLWAHNIKRMFNDVLQYSLVTINLLKPGNYIPPHKDLFYKLLQNVPKHTDDLEPVRINIFLQDAQIGHFFEMNGETWMNYKKGDYTVIRKGVIHSVVNIGHYPRYTMQVSGLAKKGYFT